MAEHVFEFEEWLTKNKLNDLQQCFIDYDMTKLDALNMNNPQFMKLMGDQTILSNAHLIQNIVKAIQSLPIETKPIIQKRLIFTTPAENKIFSKLEKYINDLDKLKNELQTTTNNNIENRKRQNNKDIEKYSTRNSQGLVAMNAEINKTINKLHAILTQTEQILESKINEHRNSIKQIDSRHTEQVGVMTNTLESCLLSIENDIKYFQGSITKCRDIVNKYEKDTDDKSDQHLFKRSDTSHRANEIIKIGNNATGYYQKNLGILNHKKQIVTTYADNELVLNMQQIYSIHINGNIYNKLVQSIGDKLIKLTNNKDPNDQKDQKEDQKDQHEDIDQSIIDEVNEFAEVKDEKPAVSAVPAAYSQYMIPPMQLIESKEDKDPPPPQYNPIAKLAQTRNAKQKSHSNSSNIVVVNQADIDQQQQQQQQIVVVINNSSDYPMGGENKTDEIASNPHEAYAKKLADSKSKPHSPPMAFDVFWECTVCTIADNPGTFLVCKVCGSSRQLSQRKKPASASDVGVPPLIIPESKLALHSDSNEAKADYNLRLKNGDIEGDKGKRIKRSQSFSPAAEKKKGWFGLKKKKKKSSKSKSKKSKEV